jgi:hypothetical protein
MNPSRPLDVFDAATVDLNTAAYARAGFTAIPNCEVVSFFYSNGEYRTTVRLAPKGAPVPISARTIAELVTRALTLREALGLSISAEEAA